MTNGVAYFWKKEKLYLTRKPHGQGFNCVISTAINSINYKHCTTNITVHHLILICAIGFISTLSRGKSKNLIVYLSSFTKSTNLKYLQAPLKFQMPIIRATTQLEEKQYADTFSDQRKHVTLL